MKCPKCDAPKNSVKTTKHQEDGKETWTLRARECNNCGCRFMTGECILEIVSVSEPVGEEENE